MGRRISRIFIIIGLLMLLTALCITSFNIWSAHKAGKNAENIVSQVEANMESMGNKDYLFNPQMKMPTVIIDGREYIGVLEVPALELKLPVMCRWDYSGLKISPCRYEGSAYADNLIIAAHNYRGHFGKIRNLNEGDEVIFTDVNKNSFVYSVVVKEQLESTDVEEMKTGGWDLTLFTCTIGGQSRITIRCEKNNI